LFFPPPKSEYFFQQHWESEYFFRKKTITPPLRGILEKKIALCATKKINILTLVLSEKEILNETKNHNPPFQVKWSVPKTTIYITTAVVEADSIDYTRPI
jgi:hypothetical protein